MTQVMIDLPDELVARIDSYARWRQTTRSDFVRDLAERELGAMLEARRQRIHELLSRPKTGFDGRAVEHVRALRNGR